MYTQSTQTVPDLEIWGPGSKTNFWVSIYTWIYIIIKVYTKWYEKRRWLGIRYI